MNKCKLPMAYSKSSLVTEVCLTRAACNAASLIKFAKSAPENPGVNVANLSEKISGDSDKVTPFICCSKISFLSITVGKSIKENYKSENPPN